MAWSPSVHNKNVMISFRETPRAIALVLGPLGSSERTLKYFSQMYLGRSCAVIASRSPPISFFLAQHRALRPIAIAALKETASVLRQVSHQENHTPNASTASHSQRPPPPPLVLHSYSNGGYFLIEEIERLIYKEPDTIGISDQDIRLIKTRMELGYQFLDSCPCYLRMLWNPSDSAMASSFGAAFPHPKWSIFWRCGHTLAATLALTLWCVFTGSFGRAHDLWTHAIHSPCRHQFFMYSTCDTLSDAAAVDRLVEIRRNLHGDDVKVYRYNDSGHVVLWRDHHEEYEAALDEALTAATTRSENKHAAEANTSM